MAQDKDVKFLEVKTANGRLVFTFGNGQTVKFNPAEVSEKMREMAMVHGFNQKLRDSTAGFSKTKDYDGALDAIGKVINGLYNDEWNRAGGGAAGIVMADLATALAQLRNVEFEKAMAAVEKATPEQRGTWAKNAKVAAIMADLKAARAKKAAENAGDDDLEAISFD